jgi:hypothetical protein
MDNTQFFRVAFHRQMEAEAIISEQLCGLINESNSAAAAPLPRLAALVLSGTISVPRDLRSASAPASIFVRQA